MSDFFSSAYVIATITGIWIILAERFFDFLFSRRDNSQASRLRGKALPSQLSRVFEIQIGPASCLRIAYSASLLLAVFAAIYLLSHLGETKPDGTELDGAGDAGTTLCDEPPEVVEIVIAIQDLPQGITIPENGISYQAWPINSLPEPGSYFVAEDIDEVVGKVARVNIVRSAPILSRQLVESEEWRLGGFGTQTIGSGETVNGMVRLIPPADLSGDVWAFEGLEGQAVTVSMDVEEMPEGIRANPTLWLLSSSGEIMEKVDNMGGAHAEIVDYELPHTGRYFILVSGYFQPRGLYALSLSIAQ